MRARHPLALAYDDEDYEDDEDEDDDEEDDDDGEEEEGEVWQVRPYVPDRLDFCSKSFL
jgi:hypothetical protein